MKKLATLALAVLRVGTDIAAHLVAGETPSARSPDRRRRCTLPSRATSGVGVVPWMRA